MQHNLDLITSFYRGAGIKHPDMKKVLDISIPLPPLELQKEIVHILDRFSTLVAELKSELQAELPLRQKQYEYYEEYLIFNEQFKIAKLKDICTVNQGLQISINQRYKENGKNRYKYLTIQFLKEKNGTVPDLPHNKFYELEVPLPSIEEQNKIVSILDSFDAITNDLKQGLPAEINLREKQYSYYQDILLNF